MPRVSFGGGGAFALHLLESCPPLGSWASHACLTFLCDKIHRQIPIQTQITICIHRSALRGQKMHQEHSLGVYKIAKFSGGACPQTPLHGTLPYLIFKTNFAPPYKYFWMKPCLCLRDLKGVHVLQQMEQLVGQLAQLNLFLSVLTKHGTWLLSTRLRVLHSLVTTNQYSI